MNYIGRKNRFRHLLFKHSQTGLMMPIDHGVTVGPLKGIDSVDSIKRWIYNDNISAVIAHKGMIENLLVEQCLHPSTGVVVHLNGMPNVSGEGDEKCMLTTVETAVRIGADGVSAQFNFGDTNFQRNIDGLAQVVEQAHSFGMPILIMAYDKSERGDADEKKERLRNIIRMICELGCDAIKLGMPAHSEDFSDIIQAALGSTKIFFAGGDFEESTEIYHHTRLAVSQGAAGLCVGRKVFQHRTPSAVINRLAKLIQDTHFASQNDAAPITDVDKASLVGFI